MINNSPDLPDILQQGHTAAWNGAWKIAADCYQQAFAGDPGQSIKAIFAAHALLELGDLSSALKYYEIAARLSPDDPVPQEKIAFIHEQQGNFAESIRSYEKSAALFIKEDNHQRAANCLHRILQLNPDHNGAREKMSSLNRVKGLDLSDLTRLVDEPPVETRSEPQSPVKIMRNPLEKACETALANLASHYFELAGAAKIRRAVVDPQSGAPQPAVKSLADDPDCLALLSHLTRAVEYHVRGLSDWCLSELQALLQGGINNPAVHFLAGAILSGSRSNQALAHLKQTRSWPDYALASFLLIGKIYYTQGIYSEAAAAYLQALAVADTATLSQENIHKRPGMFKPLIQSYSRETNTTFLKNLCETIEQEINRPNWHDRLAALHAQLSSGQQTGDTMLAEVLAAGGSSLVQRFAEVKNLQDINLPDSAMEEIFYMIEDGPALLPAQLLIAENLGKQGQTAEALEKLELSAKLYALRGQTDQAIQTLELAVQLSPANIPVRSKLIDLLKKQSRLNQAVDHLKKLSEIHYQLAEPDKAHQLLEEAARQMLSAKSGRQLSAVLMHQDADLYIQDLQYQQACQVYDKILEIVPDDFFANVHAVILQDKLGNRAAVRQKISSHVHYLEDNQKSEQVAPFLKAVIAEIPDEMELRKQLAEWYHRHGNTPQAIEQLDIISVQLLKKGKNEAAVIVLKTILALNPADPTKYRQLIAYLSNRK